MRLTSTLLLAGAAAALIACGKGKDDAGDTAAMGAGAAADTTGAMGAGAAGSAPAGTTGTTTGAMSDSARMRDSLNRAGTPGTTGRPARP